ncbi:MAG: NAAT family transporter [Inquilinus sp.]|nr:NAAT family transporter [Inquilinus sp.]
MIELAVTAAIAFAVTIDPIGVGAMFAGLTRSADGPHRRHMAVKGAAIATAILLVFAVGGELLMGLLGISFAALRIAGGILLLLLAIDMVFARPSGIRTVTEPESAEAGHRDDISVFPLAIPLIAGPGAITSTLLLMGKAEGDLRHQAVVLGVLVAVLLATLLVLLFASAVSRLFGVTGINVLNRVLGVLLSALACQFVLDGVAESGVIAG